MAKPYDQLSMFQFGYMSQSRLVCDSPKIKTAKNMKAAKQNFLCQLDHWSGLYAGYKHKDEIYGRRKLRNKGKRRYF